MSNIESRCTVCNHPSKLAIEQMLLAGLSYSQIEREFINSKNPVSRGSVSTHAKKHMSYEDAIVRRVVEKQAQQAMIDVENSADTLITKEAFLKVAIQKGFENLISNETTVRISDVVKAIQTLDAMEEKAVTVTIERFKAQHEAFMRAVKEVVPEDYWNEIVEKTKSILGEVIDGEAVDEPTALESG